MEWSLMRCVTTSWDDVVNVMTHWTTGPVQRPLVEMDESPTSLKEGADLRLRCRVSSGDAAVSSIEWMHENITLSPLDRLIITSDDRKTTEPEEKSELLIRNMTVDDEGFYKCRASVIGSADVHESPARKIHVEKVVVKARQAIHIFSDEGDHILGTSGQRLFLSARHEDLSGCKDLRYDWYFLKGSNASEQSRSIAVTHLHPEHYDGENMTFQISKARTSMSGVYKLLVHACGRNGSKSFTVSVTEPEAHEDQRNPIQRHTIVLPFVSWKLTVYLTLTLVFLLIIWLVATCVRRSNHLDETVKLDAPQKCEPYNGKSFLVKAIASTRASKLGGSYDGQLIPASMLSLEKGLIGSGAYGCVSKAKLGSRDVAVKRAKVRADNNNQKSLSEELAILRILQSGGIHKHVVAMIGIVDDKEIMIVFEFCPYGNLLSFLRDSDFFGEDTEIGKRVDKIMQQSEGYCNKTGKAMTAEKRLFTSDLFLYATQVSKAMEFLAEKRIIHRDVAARNVLVFSQSLVKLCDFGLSKKCDSDLNYEYVTDGQKALPYKWMAPVSISFQFLLLTFRIL